MAENWVFYLYKQSSDIILIKVFVGQWFEQLHRSILVMNGCLDPFCLQIPAACEDLKICTAYGAWQWRVKYK